MRLERHRKAWMGVFLAGAVALGAGRWHFARQANGIVPAAQRVAMRDAGWTQLNGKKWRLDDHRGQVVLINYWATWCGPCKEELPGLLQLYSEKAGQGLSVVGVPEDVGSDAAGKVRAFVALYRVPYVVALPDETLGAAADIAGIPRTVLVDKEGRVAKVYAGAVEGKDLEKDVSVLLAES